MLSHIPNNYIHIPIQKSPLEFATNLVPIFRLAHGLYQRVSTIVCFRNSIYSKLWNNIIIMIVNQLYNNMIIAILKLVLI
jgi:hypothetical protein